MPMRDAIVIILVILIVIIVSHPTVQWLRSQNVPIS